MDLCLSAPLLLSLYPSIAAYASHIYADFVPHALTNFLDLIMTRILVLVVCILLSIPSLSAHTGPGQDAGNSDTLIVQKGEALFERKCASCHNFRQDAIGPQLGGVTTRMSNRWLERFIRNPKSVIQSGDKHAAAMVQKYHAVMPSFETLNKDQVHQLIAFLATKKATPKSFAVNATAVRNPVPAKIPMSDMILTLDSLVKMPESSLESPRTRINKLDYEPSTGDLFIMDLRGTLYKLVEGKAVPFLDVAREIPAFIHEPGLGTGLGSFAFHPDYIHNGLLYTAHTEAARSGKADFYYEDTIRSTVQWVITEWKTMNPESAPFKGSSRELFRLDMVEGMHGVQELAFNPTVGAGSPDYGKLYIGIGDGASAEKGFPFLVGDHFRVWGKILRIDPSGTNSRNGKYGIPKDNPFAAGDARKVLPEIYAFGFRNPNRINWTSNGTMLATNIGHSNIESLYAIRPGTDQGWPFREGNFEIHVRGNMNDIFPLPANDAGKHYNYPIAIYDHDEGKAIAGGYAYSGTKIKALAGRYIFGDIVSGRLFYINMKEASPGRPAPVHEWRIKYQGHITTLHDLCKNDRVDLRFGHDKSGELYVLTKSDGMVYQLLP